MEVKIQAYERACTAPIEDILRLIADETVIKANVGGYMVNTKSLRLKNFLKSTTCSCCGLEATHFAVESNSGRKPSWHLNMWADMGPDVPEILFTHDHTTARGLGGADDEDNTTTMCAMCNSAKGVAEGHMARAIRKGLATV